MNTVRSVVKNKTAKALDGFFDGTYLAQSLFPNAMVYLGESSEEAKDFQVDFYQSDDVAIAIVLAALFALVSIAVRCRPATEDSSKTYAFLLLSWPYIRDSLRGLKNGHHAVVNVATLAQCVVHCGMMAVAGPVAIAFGAMLAANFIYFRKMKNERSKGMEANELLLSKIENQGLTRLSCEDSIFRHAYQKRALNYFNAGFDGLLDGLYLYGCLIVLLSLVVVSGFTAGTPLIVAFALIGVYALSSFLSGVHDESGRQKKLEVSALACEIALLNNEKLALKAKEGCVGKRAEIDSLLNQKIQAYDLLTQEPDLAGKSELGKAVFYMGRGCLSGVKNAKAAIYSFSLMCNNAIASVVFKVVTVVACVFYAAYLTAAVAVDRFKPREPQHEALLAPRVSRASFFSVQDSAGESDFGHASDAESDDEELHDVQNPTAQRRSGENYALNCD